MRAQTPRPWSPSAHVEERKSLRAKGAVSDATPRSRERCRERPDALGSTRPFVLPLAAAGDSGRSGRRTRLRSRETPGRSRAQCNGTSQHSEMAALASTTAASHTRVDQGTAKQRCGELEKGRSQTQNSRLGTRNFTPSGQNRRRRSPGREDAGAEHGARRGGQAGGQMEPLHLSMMRALWIWRTHEMRLVASCNQVARAC